MFYLSAAFIKSYPFGYGGSVAHTTNSQKVLLVTLITFGSELE